METTLDLCKTVDDLAAVQAQIARLEIEEKALKAELIDSLQKEIVGTAHKAQVVYSPESKFCDYKGVVTFLCVGQAVLDRFMKKKAAFSKVTLYGL